jgi:hypothetical protein
MKGASKKRNKLRSLRGCETGSHDCVDSGPEHRRGEAATGPDERLLHRLVDQHGVTRHRHASQGSGTVEQRGRALVEDIEDHGPAGEKAQLKPGRELTLMKRRRLAHPAKRLGAAC